MDSMKLRGGRVADKQLARQLNNYHNKGVAEACKGGQPTKKKRMA